jgi:ribosomal protein S18 acetylase RimI-like enzyme
MSELVTVNGDDMSLEQETRQLIESRGAEALPLDDVTESDVDLIPWAGGPNHANTVRQALARRSKGEVDYLVLRGAGGLPVAVGSIDYAKQEGAGTIWQLATMPSLRGFGLGSRLIAAAEERIKRRGLHTAMLGVEDTNVRARHLYERLGYRLCGHERQSWEAADDRGRPYTHHAEVDLLKKDL